MEMGIMVKIHVPIQSRHSGDPDQVVPFVLNTAPLYTHMLAAACLVALSPAFVSDTFVQLLQCTFYWLQLNKHFSLLISLRDQQTFFHIHSFCWKLVVATTALNF
jgi:hypothetical protein